MVTLVSVLLGAVGAYYTVQLYKNLRSDLEELLPTTARSVIDLQEVTRRLESVDHLAIFVFSGNPAASKKFVVDLANRLNALPKDAVSSVEYKIDRELQFFTRRQALYMQLDDLKKIRDYIRARIGYEKELHNPLNIFSGEEINEPFLDFEALRRKYASRMSAYARFPDGFYATPDEKIRIVLANMPGSSSSITQKHKTQDAVTRVIQDLKPKSYAPDIEVKYAGGVQEALEENEALMSDLGMSSVIVLVAVSIAMLLFFRSFRATTLLVFSVFTGAFWTFGLSFFAVGYLNANSAFLGSIVIGNGLNFGVIFLARYMEERRRGTGHNRAAVESMVHTATATWTAALAAGLSYGSLMLTQFRGFNQFGLIGLFGMVLCWLSAFTILPALLTVLDRILPMNYRGKPAPQPIVAGRISDLIRKYPRAIWGIAFALTVASAATVVRYNSGIMETNLGKLRNKKSMTEGAGYLTKYMDQIFQRYLSPLAILTDSAQSARKVEALLQKQQEREGPNTMISDVSTLFDFLPSEQYEKIEVLREIRKLLPERFLVRMNEHDQKLVGEFLTPEAFRPITMTDLPPLVLAKFTEKDGSIGKMVVVEPPFKGEDIWKAEKMTGLIHSLRDTADSVTPGAPVAGSVAITSDLYEAIARDGPRATLFAFTAVILLVVFLFRNWSTIAQVLFALLLGVVWLIGVILGFWIKINFLNFIALPITFGIGVDYGVNIFQRYREDRNRDILRVIRETGGAVGLCSITTIIGYSSLLLAENQGFVSFGLLAVAGEITCVLAAILALPAYLYIRENPQDR